MRLVNFCKNYRVENCCWNSSQHMHFLFTHSQQVPKSQNQAFVESFCACEMMMSCLTKQQWKFLFKQELKALHCHLNSSASDDESESDIRWGTTLFLNRLYWSLPLFVISTSSQNQLPTNYLRHNELQEEVHMPCYLWPRFSYYIFKFFQTRPSSTRSVLQSTSCTTLSTEISGYTDPSEAVHATRIFEWVGQRNGITNDRGCWIGYAFGFGKVWVFVGGGCWWFR